MPKSQSRRHLWMIKIKLFKIYFLDVNSAMQTVGQDKLECLKLSQQRLSKCKSVLHKFRFQVRLDSKEVLITDQNNVWEKGIAYPSHTSLGKIAKGKTLS